MSNVPFAQAAIVLVAASRAGGGRTCNVNASTTRSNDSFQSAGGSRAFATQ
jgi:hypothetical protein